MDFEDFAEQFRKRTAERLIEFEKTLEKAQREMEQGAKNAAAQAKREAQAKNPPASQNTWHSQQRGGNGHGDTSYGATGHGATGYGEQQWPQNRPLEYRTPNIRVGRDNHAPGNQTETSPQPASQPRRQPLEQQKPAPRRTPGKVKSVLRRSHD